MTTFVINCVVILCCVVLAVFLLNYNFFYNYTHLSLKNSNVYFHGLLLTPNKYNVCVLFHCNTTFTVRCCKNSLDDESVRQEFLMFDLIRIIINIRNCHRLSFMIKHLLSHKAVFSAFIFTVKLIFG